MSLNPQMRRSLRVSCFLTLSLCLISLTLWQCPGFCVVNQESEKSQVSPPDQAANPEHQEPDYVPGELIVKLRDGHTPDELNDLNQQFNVTSTEPVFKKFPTPEETLKSLKDRLATLAPSHDSWHWPLDKASKEYTDYEARIAQEQAALETQINAQEALITHLAERQARAPERAQPPALDTINLLKTAKEANIPAMAAAYSANPAVAYAEPNYIAHVQAFPDTLPNDTYVDANQDNQYDKSAWGQSYENLWGLKKIEADKAWKITQGEGVIVAVIDTGVDYNHEDLAANIWNDATGKHGFDFVNNDTDPMDDFGHGTHVAGTIAAVGNNQRGMIGVAPKANIMALKGLGADGGGSMSGLANCLRYAADQGADILNNSWGGYGRSELIEETLRYVYLQGGVIVAAAGNNNTDASFFFPAGSPYAITVASVDHQGGKSSFSNYGVKIDVAAPGSGIANEPVPGGFALSNILSTLPDDSTMGRENPGLKVAAGYYRLAGTSMAAPHVAGVAALVLSRRGTFTNEEVRQILRTSAEDQGLPGFDPQFGFGIVQALRALEVNSVGIAKITSPTVYTLMKAGRLAITGTAAGQNFQSYQLFYTSFDPFTIFPWTPVGSPSLTPVTDDPLGQWEVLKTGQYLLRLTVTDQQGRNFHAIVGPIFVDANLHAGWPRDVGVTPGFSSPFVIADLNGDRSQEIVVGNQEGGVSVFRHDGSVLPGWPKDLGSPIVSDVVAGDIDQDGDLEIFFAALNHRVYGYHHDGTPVQGWPQEIQESPYEFYSIVMGDVDQNGPLEVVVLPTFFEFAPVGVHHVYVFQGTGELLTKWPLYDVRDRSTDGPTGPVLADIDGNGTLELVILILNKRDARLQVEILDYRGNLLKSLILDGIPVSGSRAVDFSRPVVGDLDRDGDPEIAISRSYRNSNGFFVGRLFVWSYDGGAYTPRIARDIQGGTASQLALGDVDRDGNLEVLLGSRFLDEQGSIRATAEVKAFRYDGSLLWKSNPNDAPVSDFDASPIIGDVDGDGEKEVLLLEQTAHAHDTALDLYIFNHDGSLGSVAQLPGQTLERNYVPAAIADLDGNGDVEVVAMNHETGWLAAWDMPAAYNPLLLDWPQFQHDPMRTGHYQRVNHAPVLNPIGNKRVNEGESLSFAVSGSDPEGDVLTFSASDLPSGASFNAATGRFHWAPAFDQAGTYPVTFKATDPTGLFASEAITITVTNVNRPPTATVTPPSVRVRVGETATVRVSGSDPDGDRVYYAAYNTPSGASFDPSTGTLRWTPQMHQVGNHEVVFVVQDRPNPPPPDMKQTIARATITVELAATPAPHITSFSQWGSWLYLGVLHAPANGGIREVVCSGRGGSRRLHIVWSWVWGPHQYVYGQIPGRLSRGIYQVTVTTGNGKKSPPVSFRVY